VKTTYRAPLPPQQLIVATIVIAFFFGMACTNGSANSNSPQTHASPLGPAVTSATNESLTPVVKRLQEPGWVEVGAGVFGSEAESPVRARERAVTAARRAAVEFIAGVRVKSHLLSFEQLYGADSSTLLQELITTRADALVVDERVISSTMTPQPGGGYRVDVILHAQVLDRSGASDPDFEVQVSVGRERFLEGEEVTISVTSNRDSRIYVLGVYEAGGAILLPNQYSEDTRIKAGERFEFPNPAERSRGIRLIAAVPPGQSETRETLFAIALRNNRTLTGIAPTHRRESRTVEASGSGALLADFLLPLADLPANDWTFDQITYEVLAARRR
jgi:hypothetical protein